MDSSSKNKTLQALYWIIAISFILIIFTLDYVTPLGISVGILYLIPIYCTIFLINNKYSPFLLSIICTGLIILGATLGTGALEPGKAYINRAITILFIILGTTIITLFKKSMIRYRWSEKKLRTAIDSAPTGILLVDRKGTITTANKEVERMFGYEPGELRGTSVESLVPEKYRQHHKAYRARFHQTPQTRAMGSGRDLYGVRKDGSEVPVEIGLTPLETENEFFVMSSIIDITERKKQERELLELNKHLLGRDREREIMISELRQSNQELDDFAYIASHDLKEPLRGIFNNAKFLMEDYEDKLGEDGARRLGRMSFLCQRMESLVNDLLYFSRLGRKELAIKPTNIKEVIGEIKAIYQEDIESGAVILEVDNPLPTIICDRPRITEVFRNLISNSLKYNDQEVKEIHIGHLSPGDEENQSASNAFYVRDNGIGIDEMFHEEIFRIFKRLNEEDESKKGTGVGLTFVKKIVERHGGKIWLKSAKGSGSTFYFSIAHGGHNE